MDKEQYNSFDDWFREAAAQPGPDFNESAWQKMEARLDGEKKKRRRVIFWWWFTGMLIGGTLLGVVLQNNFVESLGIKNSQDIQVNRSQQSVEPPAANNTFSLKEPTVQEATIPHTQIEPAQKSPEPINESENSGLLKEPRSDNPVAPSPKAAAAPVRKKTYAADLQESRPNGLAGTAPMAKKQSGRNGKGSRSTAVPSSGKEQVSHPTDQDNESIEEPAKDAAAMAPEKKDTTATASEKMVEDSSAKIAKEIPVKDSVAAVKSDPKKSTEKPVKKPHFFVFGTVAPEWSFIKSRGAGKAALSYGGGLGYTFNSRWAVQAGVYFSGKKYMAGEGDYTPKPGSYYDNPNYVIESVDADCSVLEIPVSVRYTFIQKKKNNLFVLAGLSTAIMKKEDYVYDYMRYGNPTYSSYTYKTGKAHFLSAASIAIGLEHQLNRKFSILFAPYLNLPLQGIGEGQVHLNSFGIQAGLKYNLPF